MTATLDALFHPSSIAFIGASERPNAPASRGLRNCMRLGFGGGLYPVNPRYDELFGARCHPRIEGLPEVPDLAMIALNADATLAAVEACRDLGVKVVVACSSGWEEQGPEGVARAERLRQILAGSPMRLLGPNCLGAGNPALGMSLGYNSSFESLSHRRRGRIALVTQSGAMMGGLILNAEDAGVDLGLYAHVGNAMDIGMEELVEHLVVDPAIDAIALMIEGLRQPARFVAAIESAHRAGKPIVAFKAGTSELGQRAVMSHTGALAGSDEVFSAVCRERGVIRVDECEDLLPAAALLTAARRRAPMNRGGVLIFTLSGGAASILADECHAAGVPIPSLSAPTLARLDAILPPYLKAGNPLDVGGGVFTDVALPRTSLAAAIEDEAIDSVMWVGVGAPRDERSTLWLDDALDVLGPAQQVGLVVPVSGHPQEAGFERARECGVPVMRSLRSAARLLGLVRAAARKLPAAGVAGTDLPPLPEATLVDEARAKALLVALGIPTPASRVAARAEDVRACATEIGLPVVVKGLAAGVAHKSELGLVALGLATPDAAAEAALAMRHRQPGLTFNGFLVERMAPRGIEVVLGIKRDPDFGPVLMFGLGGISVELFRDVAFGTCPLSSEGANELIDRTKAATLLTGFRGQPEADREALVRAMVRLSQFAAHHADRLAEMDVNPLLVLPKGDGVMALDAVIACRQRDVVAGVA